MSSAEYNQLLKFLYFEGYADSYEEAEYILEEMSDEEFEELLENQTWQNVRRASSTSKTNTTPIKLTGSNTALRPGDFTPEDPEKTEKRAKRGKLSFEVREDFDAIVEFLFVEGFADTIENAELMAENISEEWVDEILDETAKDQSDKQIEKGVKTTYKAQNVIDNQHQGRSPGLNRLPANERSAKSKRMQGRLKARRDDLFQERGNREDQKREQLKKLLGL